MAAAALVTASAGSSKAAERAARAARARRQGNQRKDETPAPTAVSEAPKVVPKVVPPKALPTRKPRAVKTVVETDTQEKQAARALANLKAAEAQQPKPGWLKADTETLTEPQPENNFDLDSALDAMDTTFLQCRDFGHSWAPFTARWVQKELAYESQLRCARCKTIRTRWLSKTGQQLSGQYDYTEGYLVKGMGRLTGTDRDKVRLRSILSVVAPDHSGT